LFVIVGVVVSLVEIVNRDPFVSREANCAERNAFCRMRGRSMDECKGGRAALPAGAG
jgi:hypothetical protein